MLKAIAFDIGNSTYTSLTLIGCCKHRTLVFSNYSWPCLVTDLCLGQVRRAWNSYTFFALWKRPCYLGSGKNCWSWQKNNTNTWKSSNSFAETTFEKSLLFRQAIFCSPCHFLPHSCTRVNFWKLLSTCLQNALILHLNDFL